MRDRSVRRHHSKRVIRKRISITKNRWSGTPPSLSEKPGKLRKFNLSCGCYMCKICRKSGHPLKHPD